MPRTFGALPQMTTRSAIASETIVFQALNELVALHQHIRRKETY